MTTASRTTLRDLIAARGCALFDGAMGTMLQNAGLEAGESGERWNLDRAEAVAEIHRGYAAAGSVLVTTNTFGGTAPRLAAAGLEDRVAEVNAAAVRIARSVADEFGALVAGDVGPTGELIEPLGTLSGAEAQAIFAEQIEALAGAGADLILGETLSDLAEAEAVVRAAHDAAPELEKRPRLVATLQYRSIWDMWYRFKLFVVYLYDFDSHQPLLAAGQGRDNMVSNEELVIKDTFIEIKRALNKN